MRFVKLVGGNISKPRRIKMIDQVLLEMAIFVVNSLMHSTSLPCRVCQKAKSASEEVAFEEDVYTRYPTRLLGNQGIKAPLRCIGRDVFLGYDCNHIQEVFQSACSMVRLKVSFGILYYVSQAQVTHYTWARWDLQALSASGPPACNHASVML